ncbi:hypothetical protein Cs7R123_51380 [Catellatospora sp. TT07R-123]|uniref:hypothetical protein n=1 Tax=Catellatospora sp. TT07R-123 TaxID=2733863 RepID=UPI001B0AE7E5|nr:hypothetical protein [Catellatospora sp. TT07R-123]GHJ47796.1 hypothetical protein Cs7R123_51380 [Catellatospora sp. TT07R-123]
MRRFLPFLPVLPLAALLLLLPGCGGSGAALPPPPSAAPDSPGPQASPVAGQWPTPADCVFYDPARLRVGYEAGVYTVADGATPVLRLHGGPGAASGGQGLALAQRYRRHCYVGRGNAREDGDTFVFDYWLDPSGRAAVIEGEQDNCSAYEPGHLIVEDMGHGDGWRVKDHDHILHVFDTEADARAGSRVLANYHRICFLGGYDGEAQEVVTYFP